MFYISQLSGLTSYVFIIRMKTKEKSIYIVRYADFKNFNFIVRTAVMTVRRGRYKCILLAVAAALRCVISAFIYNVQCSDC